MSDETASLFGQVRPLFTLPDDVVYLRCASAGPLLADAHALGRQGLAKKATPWVTGRRESHDDVEYLRGLVARLIGARADDIAIVPSASYGLSIAAANIDVGPGRQVVVLDEQFPSHVYPWRHAVAMRGGSIHTVARAPHDEWTGGVIDAIGSSTSVVAIPECHWVDASRVDLVTVSQRCREVGAALVLDLSQSLGAIPFNVSEVQPDFMVSVAEKWLLGPYTMAFLYAAPHRQQGTPIEHSWNTRAGSDDHARLVEYRDDYLAGARRYDMGERHNYVGVPVAIRSLEQILEWGVPRIAAELAPVVHRIAQGAGELGMAPTAAGSRSPHYLGLRSDGGLPARIGERLQGESIYVSIRGDSIRVAPHLYNTWDEIERFLTVLARLLHDTGKS